MTRFNYNIAEFIIQYIGIYTRYVNDFSHTVAFEMRNKTLASRKLLNTIDRMKNATWIVLTKVILLLNNFEILVQLIFIIAPKQCRILYLE